MTMALCSADFSWFNLNSKITIMQISENQNPAILQTEERNNTSTNAVIRYAGDGFVLPRRTSSLVCLAQVSQEMTQSVRITHVPERGTMIHRPDGPNRAYSQPVVMHASSQGISRKRSASYLSSFASSAMPNWRKTVVNGPHDIMVKESAAELKKSVSVQSEHISIFIHAMREAKNYSDASTAHISACREICPDDAEARKRIVKAISNRVTSDFNRQFAPLPTPIATAFNAVLSALMGSAPQFEEYRKWCGPAIRWVEIKRKAIPNHAYARATDELDAHDFDALFQCLQKKLIAARNVEVICTELIPNILKSDKNRLDAIVERRLAVYLAKRLHTEVNLRPKRLALALGKERTLERAQELAKELAEQLTTGLDQEITDALNEELNGEMAAALAEELPNELTDGLAEELVKELNDELALFDSKMSEDITPSTPSLFDQLMYRIKNIKKNPTHTLITTAIKNDLKTMQHHLRKENSPYEASEDKQCQAFDRACDWVTETASKMPHTYLADFGYANAIEQLSVLGITPELRRIELDDSSDPLYIAFALLNATPVTVWDSEYAGIAMQLLQIEDQMPVEISGAEQDKLLFTRKNDHVIPILSFIEHISQLKEIDKDTVSDLIRKILDKSSAKTYAPGCLNEQGRIVYQEWEDQYSASLWHKLQHAGVLIRRDDFDRRKEIGLFEINSDFLQFAESVYDKPVEKRKQFLDQYAIHSAVLAVAIKAEDAVTSKDAFRLTTVKEAAPASAIEGQMAVASNIPAVGKTFHGMEAATKPKFVASVGISDIVKAEKWLNKYLEGLGKELQFSEQRDKQQKGEANLLKENADLPMMPLPDFDLNALTEESPAAKELLETALGIVHGADTRL
ncbi:hypothetical protein [Noviherbaspirillum saxi]|uniref:Uncharacterized protein n=1 Tax=Noviherbaspirillum saxi TaxID=2320863 RepID=A0A3A3FFP0_9BURK|nr:hypothetical protein [Noviherbaspirillum saxi]RJF92176.1 hypothetical protein D3871_26400 [Noviherbaspirillum saxi]